MGVKQRVSAAVSEVAADIFTGEQAKRRDFAAGWCYCLVGRAADGERALR